MTAVAPLRTDPAARVVGPRDAVLTALTALTLLGATIALALGTAVGQEVDADAMAAVVERRDARLSVLSVLGYVSIGAVALVAAACLAVALARGSVRLAVAAVVLIAGANLTTQVLKHAVLERPDHGLGVLNSLPSGHTTVVASAAAALALVVPRAAQPLVAAAGAFAVTMTGTSTIVAGWHRPADVLASCAVTLLWTGLAAAGLGRHSRPARGLAPAALAGAVLSCAALLAIGVRPSGGWSGFVDAGLVLAVTALAIAAWSWATSRLGG